MNGKRILASWLVGAGLSASLLAAPGPLAQDDWATVNPGQPVVIDPLANDSHVRGVPLSLSANLSNQCGGTVQLNGDGTFTLTPPAGLTGSCQIGYTVVAGNSGSAAATVTVQVAGVAPPSGSPTDPVSLLHLDSPGDGQTLSGVVRVEGHALDGSGISGLSFTLDGQPVTIAGLAQGLPRPSVCADLNDVDPACPNVGFSGWLDTRNLTFGGHQLTVFALNGNGDQLQLTRDFLVRNSGAVPIVEDDFGSTGCRAGSGLLGGSCVDVAENGLEWVDYGASDNCWLAGVSLTNRQDGNCFGDVPFVFRDDATGTFSDRDSYIGGLNEVALRLRVLLDGNTTEAGADWATVGFHDGSATGRLYMRLERNGSWGIYGNGGALLTAGQLSSFQADTFSTMELRFDRASHQASAWIDDVQVRSPFGLGSNVDPNTLFAGFHIGADDPSRPSVGSFRIDDFEILADAVADGPYVTAQGVKEPDQLNTYLLIKPTSWSASRVIAENLGGSLVKIDGKCENDEIYQHWQGFDTSAYGVPVCGTVPTCSRMCDFGVAQELDAYWLGLSRSSGAPWSLATWEGGTSWYSNWDTGAGQPLDNSVCDSSTIPAEFTGMVVDPNRAGLWRSSRDEPLIATMGVVEIVEPQVDGDTPAMAFSSPAQNAVVSGDLEIRGWAVDGSGVVSLTSTINGVPAQMSYGTYRPWACDARCEQDPNCPSVGFDGEIDTSQFANGTYTLKTVAVDAAGNARTVNRTITIANGETQAPTVGLDYPEPAQRVAGVLEVTGFALDASGVASVTFDLDGAPINLGNYAYGDDRAADCAAAGNVDPACPNVGFHGSLDTRAFADGPATLTVTAVDGVGNPASVTRSFFIDNADGVPVAGDSFVADGLCGRFAGSTLNSDCVERGDASLLWQAGNCELRDGHLTNTAGTDCWANFPFTMKHDAAGNGDPWNTIGGLTRLSTRMRAQFDRPEAAGTGASAIAVGIGRADGTFDDRLLFRVWKTGQWAVYWEREPENGGLLLGSGSVAINATDWVSLELTYERLGNTVSASIQGTQVLAPLNLGLDLGQPRLPVIEIAGFHASIPSGVRGFFADDFELVADAVLDGPYEPSGFGTYHLLKPTSRSGSHAIAEAMGGHLATVNSSLENTTLYNRWATFDVSSLGIPQCGAAGVPDCSLCDFGTLGQPDGLWLGYHRPDGVNWLWDGPASSYTNWDAGEPASQNQCPVGTFEPANQSVVNIAAGTAKKWRTWRDQPTVLILGVVEQAVP